MITIDSTPSEIVADFLAMVETLRYEAPGVYDDKSNRARYWMTIQNANVLADAIKEAQRPPEHKERDLLLHIEALERDVALLRAKQDPTQFPHGAPISKTGGKHQVDGFFAGEIDWNGEKHPIMAIPVRVGWMLHIYAPGQLVARESGETI